jgi:hypothetical protein
MSLPLPGWMLAEQYDNNFEQFIDQVIEPARTQYADFQWIAFQDNPLKLLIPYRFLIELKGPQVGPYFCSLSARRL